MGSPSSPPLTVEESDGTNSNRPVTDLKFNAADFTIAASGRSSTVSLSGGGGTIGGSITEGQVAFGAATADEIEGEAAFTYDKSINQLKLTGFSDTNAEFLIERSAGNDQTIGIENDSSSNPKIIVKSGYGTNTKLMEFRNSITNTAVTGGTSGFIYYAETDGAAGVPTTQQFLKMTTTDSVNFEVVFNEDSKAGQDFRIESDAYPNMFMLDGGFNKIFMGNGSVVNDADLGLVQISVGNSTQTALSLISTDADATSAPTLQFWRNSSTPTAGDQLGIIEFKGEDSAGTRVLYASMNSQIDSTATGNHFSSIQFEVLQNGNQRTNLRIRNSEVVVNEDSIDCNFRVEGVGTQTLISADAALNTVAINGVVSSDADLTVHHTNASSTDATLRLTSTDGGANDAPRLELYRNSSSPAAGDNLGEIVFSGENDAGSKVYRLASIRVDIPDVSSGSEDGWLQFGAMDDGTFIDNMLTVRGDARQVVVNEDGNSTNFRVQGNSAAYLLFGNTTNEFISINGNGAASGLADNEPKLQVEGSITGKMPIVVQNSDATLTRAGLSGQTYVCTDGGTTALTMPLGAEQGDYFYFVSTSGSFQIVVDVGTQTLNGGTSALTRGTNNEVYTVICVEDNKFILSNPA